MVLVGVCAALFALLAGAGLVLDLSRIVLTKKALQTVYDGAALAASMELDGTAEGHERAKGVVDSWKDGGAFEWQAIESGLVEIGRDEKEVEFVRVSGGVKLPLTLVRLAVAQDATMVWTASTARRGDAAFTP